MRIRVARSVVIVFALLAASYAQQQPVRILFIGNSYTYYNNLPEMFASMAASNTPPRHVEVVTVAAGGATLGSLWQQGRAAAAIRNQKWDYVVLQEQSLLGNFQMVNGKPEIGDPTPFFAAVRQFEKEIRKSGAKTVLYMTWARRDSPEMQSKLTDAYTRIAHELGAILVPAGLAWQQALKQLPGASLYIADGSHPSPAGTYLVAAVFNAALFRAEANSVKTEFTGHPFDEDKSEFDDTKQVPLAKLSPDTARQLREIASRSAGVQKH